MQNDGDCPHVRPHDCSYYAVYCKVCNPHVASVTTNMQHNPLHINISCLVVDIWQISALCILPSVQQLHSTFCTSAFYFPHYTNSSLGSRVVSMLDSGAQGPGFKSQPRRCRVTDLGKLFSFHTHHASVHQAEKLVKGCEGNCRPGEK